MFTALIGTFVDGKLNIDVLCLMSFVKHENVITGSVETGLGAEQGNRTLFFQKMFNFNS